MCDHTDIVVLFSGDLKKIVCRQCLEDVRELELLKRQVELSFGDILKGLGKKTV